MIGPKNQLVVSRILLLGWCLWLLVTWVVLLRIHTPTRTWVVESDGTMSWRVPVVAFVPVARGLYVSMILAIGLVWPAWRLSMPGHNRVGRETAVDALSLWLVAQVVIWPMRLLLEYSPQRLGWIDAALAVWTGAIAVCIWYGRLAENAWRRVASMGMCAAILFGGWIAAYLSGSMKPAAGSPIYVLWMLCGDEVQFQRAVDPLPTTAGLVVIAWALVFAASRSFRHQSTAPVQTH